MAIHVEGPGIARMLLVALALPVLRGGYSNVSDWIRSLNKSDPAIHKNLDALKSRCSAALLEA